MVLADTAILVRSRATRKETLGGDPSGLHLRSLQITVPDRYYPPRITAPALARAPGDCCDRMRARFRLYNMSAMDSLADSECNP